MVAHRSGRSDGRARGDRPPGPTGIAVGRPSQDDHGVPDRAPKRLAVARKAGSTRDLARRVEEARTQGIEDEPVVAAEKILALAGALNAHDRLTRGHGERVRAFTDLIADELDLPSPDRDRLRWSALLHDIGKLAVHPHILNKPDKLDDDEWIVMKNHPSKGPS